MATGRLLRTFLICPKRKSGALLEKIQLWGKMEISSMSEELPSGTPDETYNRLSFIAGFLEYYSPPQSAFSKLRDGLPEISLARAAEIRDSLDPSSDYENLRRIEIRIKDAAAGIIESEKENAILKSLSGVPFGSDALSFNRVTAVIGNFEKPENIERLENLPELFTEKIDEELIAVFYLKSRAASAHEILDAAGFSEVLLPASQAPGERAGLNERKIAELNEVIAESEREIKSEFLPKLSGYRALMDLHENRLQRENEARKGSETAYTNIIKGWIPKGAEPELEKILEKEFPSCHAEFYIASQEKGEAPPVLLKNSRIWRPFELVTNLYGTPGYGQLDPTPYVAPFFILFFGLCLSDAGYGFLIAAAAAVALKKYKLSASARNFMKMLLWGGGMSIFTGALLGSWFGNAAAGTFLDRVKVFDLLESPEYFLYFSVALGFFHVIFGVLLSAAKNISEGDHSEAFFSDIPWVLILVFGALYVASRVTGLPAPVTAVSGAIALIGVTGVVFFSGYKNSTAGARIGLGLYNLYGGIDYVKDMLSYSRLFALGMATGILAMAVNEIAGFLTSGFGYVLIPFVLIGGHLVLNLFMSTLSAYVHTSRLQYVEFFTKFFKGGGRVFTPLSWKSKRVSFVAE